MQERRLPWIVRHENKGNCRAGDPGLKLDTHENTVTLTRSPLDRRPVGGEALQKIVHQASAPAWRRWFRLR